MRENGHDKMKTRKSAPVDRVIQPKSGFVPIDFARLWEYRELFFFLAWRNILVLYKQTVIGISWAIIQPIMIMIIFTVIFGKLAKFPSDGIPYPVLTFVGVLPWQFFTTALSQSTQSLVSHGSLVSKVYFPRLIIPTSNVMSAMVDFGISFFILIGLMVWYQVVPSATVIFLPLFFLLAVATALGAGLWLSALNVKYRDVKYVVPFLLRLGLYISPVGFLSSIVPERYQLFYSINPMVGVIDGFRWCILGGKVVPNWAGLWISVAMVTTLLVSGACYFRRSEAKFADII